MKHTLRFTRFASFVLLLAHLAPTAGSAKDDYLPGSYKVDPGHSKVGFEIPHLVISSVEGRFNEYQGDIVLAQPFAGSSLQAEVKVASIDTAVKDRDTHLKSADFFDAGKFPTMTLKSRRFEGTPEAFQLQGDLTIKGVTKPVTFDGKYLGTVVDGYGNQKIALEAKAKINRKDFGLTWGKMVEAGPVVGDSVTIVLKLQAAKPSQKSASK
jgi:polyisoprenoid-binding protein YceI